jgi:hypothetical protein
VIKKRTRLLACIAWLVSARLAVPGQNPLSTKSPSPLSDAAQMFVTSDGADWHLKGSGMVCCPCKVPCPCRSNGKASYGHCEATLYLRIRQGNYGPVNLDNLNIVNISGDCAMSYSHVAALYFDRAANHEQQIAFLKLMSSMVPGQSAAFPYVRTVDIDTHVTDDHLYQVYIPGVLQMIVDRNWGGSEPPMHLFAASDYFSNTLQYAQNLRYAVHDSGAKLDFDYSRRQANYRDIDLDAQQYRSKSMLIQYQDGAGSFNEDQQRLIHQLNLPLPDFAAIQKLVHSTP